MKFKTATKSGVEIVEGLKFSAYIGNYKYWFFYVNSGYSTVISHLDSGFKVLDVSYTARSACLGDLKAACKLEIKNLVDRLGVERVRQVLDSAPKINP
jgi:hypothetical protein